MRGAAAVFRITTCSPNTQIVDEKVIPEGGSRSARPVRHPRYFLCPLDFDGSSVAEQLELPPISIWHVPKALPRQSDPLATMTAEIAGYFTPSNMLFLRKHSMGK
jgi:hypothetical protein